MPHFAATFAATCIGYAGVTPFALGDALGHALTRVLSVGSHAAVGSAPFPMLATLCGLLAAVSWGLSDVTARGLAQRHHPVAVYGWSAVVGAGTLGVLLPLFPRDNPLSRLGACPPVVLVLAVGLGLLLLLGNLLLFRALARGPLAVVCPLEAAYNGVTMLLAMVCSGERIAPPQLAGLVLMLAGVVVVSLDPARCQRLLHRARLWSPLHLASWASMTWSAWVAWLGSSRSARRAVALGEPQVRSLRRALRPDRGTGSRASRRRRCETRALGSRGHRATCVRVRVMAEWPTPAQRHAAAQARPADAGHWCVTRSLRGAPGTIPLRCDILPDARACAYPTTAVAFATALALLALAHAGLTPVSATKHRSRGVRRAARSAAHRGQANRFPVARSTASQRDPPDEPALPSSRGATPRPICGVARRHRPGPDVPGHPDALASTFQLDPHPARNIVAAPAKITAPPAGVANPPTWECGLSRWRGLRVSLQPGVAEALGAALALGVVYWAVRYVVPSVGSMTTAWLLRAQNALLVLPFLILQGRSPQAKRPYRERTRSTRHWRERLISPDRRRVALIGVFDATATAAYSLGVLHGATALVASLAALQMLVSVLAGAWLLRESMARSRWYGAICTLMGLMCIVL